MKKVLLVATVVKTHIMQFHLPLIGMLRDMGYQVDVAAKNDYENKADCVIHGCTNYYDIDFARNPLRTSNIRAYKQLKDLIHEGGYDIIHCNTPVAGILTRMAARKVRKSGTKVIYMAHGFHFFTGAPLKNWLLYYPIEKYCSRFTDILITINDEDYRRACRRFHAAKTEYVPGVGIDTSKFESILVSFEKPEGKTILLSVGELNYGKNHKAVIDALRYVSEDVLYWIVGDGEKREQLEEYVESIGLSNRVKLWGYRYDLPIIYHTADLFIHPSLREGLPVAVMEAMASKLPVIASDVRGNRDLLQRKALFNPRNLDEIAYKINEYTCSEHSEEVQHNFEKLAEYSLDTVLVKMKGIYRQL